MIDRPDTTGAGVERWPVHRPNPLEVSLVPEWARELHRDDRGQLSVEYLLVMLGVVLPTYFAMTGAYFIIHYHFYRTVGILSMPIP
ncbi:MAG: hypothetical protein AAGI30_00530 [Planctomycetota bacterium]